VNWIKKSTKTKQVSVIHLVDLAGAERYMQNPTLSLDAQLRSEECISINQGLTVLSRVISLLVKRAQKPKENISIPFQEHSLTMLLASSLDGQCFLSLVICIPNLNSQKLESCRTIDFRQRCLKLPLQPIILEFDDFDLKEAIEKQQSQIKELKKEIARLQGKKNSNNIRSPR
jgi:hypothetical protein